MPQVDQIPWFSIRTVQPYGDDPEQHRINLIEIDCFLARGSFIRRHYATDGAPTPLAVD
jgi:hypothetical protein